MSLVLVLTAGCLLPQPAASAPVKQVRRVLILNVMGPLSSPGVALMDEAIVADLQKSPYQIELYSEDLEATLFPDEATQRQFREWYIRKYRDRKPDVIIAVGLEPIRFMVESHEPFFPNIPIIFCGSTEEMLGELKARLSLHRGVDGGAAGGNPEGGTGTPTRNQARGRSGWCRAV